MFTNWPQRYEKKYKFSHYTSKKETGRAPSLLESFLKIDFT
jgi:hypothetical protein